MASHVVASLLERRVGVHGITFFCLSLHPRNDWPREGVVIELLLGRCESPVHDGQHRRIIRLVLALVRQPGCGGIGVRRNKMNTVLHAHWGFTGERNLVCTSWPTRLVTCFRVESGS